MRAIVILGLGMALGLAGCATYQPRPLPDRTDFGDQAVLPAKPLDLDTISALAIQRSPDLIAARAKVAVAQSQAERAGLLPDPQFNVALDHPTGPGAFEGYTLGLAQDLQSLVTQPARKEAARASASQAKLEALWLSWQTAEKAQTLAVQSFIARRRIELFDHFDDVLSLQSERSQKALINGNTTIDAAGSDLAAVLEAETRKNEAERQLLTSDAELKQLLNLQSRTQIQIAPLPPPPAISHSDVVNALQKIIHLRPDLLALQAGYHAQEEAVRESILEQFPAMTFGLSKGADTEGTHTLGVSLAVNLPIFGTTQANVRVQEATRAQLLAEYQARLDATTNDAWRLYQEVVLLRKQLDRLNSQLPVFRSMAAASARARESGDISPAVYILLQNQLQAQESQGLDLEADLWMDTLALRSLVGLSVMR